MSSPDAVSADDALATFQQEIVVAKQKQQSFAGKVSAMNSLIDPQKNGDLERQAESLLEELAKEVQSSKAPMPAVSSSPKPSVPSKPKVLPWFGKTKKKAKKIEEKPVAVVSLEKPKNDKAFPWFKIKFSPEDSGILSEGSALYKVAVSDDKITLEEAVEIGLANSIQLAATQEKIKVAEAKLFEAHRALYPTVQGVLEENGGHAPNGQRFYRGRSYKANVNQPLFYGGELVMTVKQAEENLKSAKAEYEKTRNELIHQIKTSYYGVVKAEYNAQYQAELHGKAVVFYTRVREEHEQKLVSEVDYLNTESQYQQIYFQLESAKNDLLSVKLLLYQIVSIGNEEPFPVELKLEFKKVQPDFNEVLQLGFQNNPDIRIKGYALLSAQYGVDIFKAKRMPRFDLRGSYGMLGEVFKDTTAIESDNHDLDLEKEWFLGVHGSMPLGPNTVEYDQIKHVYGPTVSAFQGSEDWRHTAKFNLFDNLSNITDEKGAFAALFQAQGDLKKSQDDVTVKLRDDFYNLQKALIQIDSAVSKMRYQEKQNSILEYMVSLQESNVASLFEGMIEYAQDRFSFIQAVTDYQLALSSLGVTIGDPNYFEKN